jgi:hypothetical protein
VPDAYKVQISNLPRGNPEQELRNGFSGTFLASRKEEINPIQASFPTSYARVCASKKIPDFL